MADVSEYPDAVRRIVNADVSPDSTTRAEVLDDLRGSAAPQIDEEVAEGVADAVVTEDRALMGIESLGTLPSEAEIEAIVNSDDDYDLDDRRQSIIDSVRDRVATADDVEDSIATRRPRTRSEVQEAIDAVDGEIRGVDPSEIVDAITTVEDVSGSIDTSDGPVFAEDVRETTEDLSTSSQEVGVFDSGDRIDEVADQASREIGAPERSDYERARTQAAMPDDAITPADRDDLSSDSKTPINVIRDESGAAVAATGGSSQGGVTPQDTAEELGVEYRDLGEINESIQLRQGDGRAELQIDGRTISEVDVQ